MRELVDTIAKALVEHPMGKVIGKQGRIAKAIRSVVKAAASRDDKKVIIDIIE